MRENRVTMDKRCSRVLSYDTTSRLLAKCRPVAGRACHAVTPDGVSFVTVAFRHQVGRFFGDLDPVLARKLFNTSVYSIEQEYDYQASCPVQKNRFSAAPRAVSVVSRVVGTWFVHVGVVAPDEKHRKEVKGRLMLSVWCGRDETRRGCGKRNTRPRLTIWCLQKQTACLCFGV